MYEEQFIHNFCCELCHLFEEIRLDLVFTGDVHLNVILSCLSAIMVIFEVLHLLVL